MPRTARLDIPDILQHVIVRGIERRAIFLDDEDRVAFLNRFSCLLEETETHCLAWALLDNHFHLLLMPQKTKLGTFMRRLLTGYAVTFNLRHKRSGHLFQNRYKSIVCEEDPYLLELVRYIHLNPFRAGIVKNMAQLEAYPWSGHAVVMGKKSLSGQNVEEVLGLFGKRVSSARKNYAIFIEDGLWKGKRSELTGGGLRNTLKMNKALSVDQAFDDRVLGSGEFVLALQSQEKEETLERTFLSLETLITRVAKFYKIDEKELLKRKRVEPLLSARAVICYLGVVEYNNSGARTGRYLNMSRSGVSNALKRGEAIIGNDEELRDKILG